MHLIEVKAAFGPMRKVLPCPDENAVSVASVPLLTEATEKPARDSDLAL